MTKPIYQEIASRLLAIENCRRSKNGEWLERHENCIEQILKATAPSGSGIDNGTEIDWEASKPDKLVFKTAFHHMNDAGYYDGWTEHKVIVRPSLALRYTVDVTGRDRNDIKDYLVETFRLWLDGDAPNDDPLGT
jgi:hypothetical protein